MKYEIPKYTPKLTYSLMTTTKFPKFRKMLAIQGLTNRDVVNKCLAMASKRLAGLSLDELPKSLVLHNEAKAMEDLIAFWGAERNPPDEQIKHLQDWVGEVVLDTLDSDGNLRHMMASIKARD